MLIKSLECVLTLDCDAFILAREALRGGKIIVHPSLISRKVNYYSEVTDFAMKMDVVVVKIDARIPEMANSVSAKITIGASSGQYPQRGAGAPRECVIHLSNETR